MTIKIVPLGAGQDVGRSCILVTLGGKNIMFDCGMHMGYNDERRFPDFTYISKTGEFTEILDAVIISHFHLDHCGALPFFTEMCGYDGPIYMTHPTKAICPILLEDYRKITVERKGETNFFTSQMIKSCMKKVIPVNLHQTISVDDDLEIKAYYAGHVLGAAMFYIRVGEESVVYTGDYNMTPDRHLGSAWIDKMRPDVLITESTYATTIRDSKRSRERDFLKKVHDCVAAGGKVIIPVFALGRAQELCILVETYWERMDLKVPIYFSAGLTEKANHYYKLFINWTNEKIKSTFVQRNMFDFKHIKPWNRNYVDLPGAMVVFATPGMLNVGTSLEVFKKWAPDPNNMVIMPGYCVAGTVGAKVLQGQKVIDVDPFTKIQVNLQVRNLSFSAHADAKGIMQLIRQCEPKNVVLVHGEKEKMGFLKSKIMKEFGIPSFDPANGETIELETSKAIYADISVDLLKSSIQKMREIKNTQSVLNTYGPQSVDREMHIDSVRPHSQIPVEGVLLMEPDKYGPPKMHIVDADQVVLPESKPPPEQHDLSFELVKSINIPKINLDLPDESDLRNVLVGILFRRFEQTVGKDIPITQTQDGVQMRSVFVGYDEDKSTDVDQIIIRWNYNDEDLACRALGIVNMALPEVS
ncbi:beta-lactamase-like protein [Umbelopsis sp. AD052]|nr:beta-lactamase-like protein [Umbelopsis sp. AD052]